jgi:hypothetical protein
MRSTALLPLFLLALSSAAAAQPAPAQTAPAQPAPVSCPHPGRAETPSPALIAARQAEHRACAADMTRLCANVPHGCGRPMQCLRAHTAELSADCTTAMTQLRAARMQPH